ncbi:hypothetical protein CDAR_458481 [Caerostris darwini]|uniref:Uncharacterized protein n=1 Tax=Caerostris darwini TaxID=1538125 RepID=A0AAV4TBY6_9ARAC|nr:hypothetical protein CDAR_458481 [Caerostris darwini]
MLFGRKSTFCVGVGWRKNEEGGLLITTIVNFRALILVEIYQFKEDEEWFLGKNKFGLGMRGCEDSEKSTFCGGVGWRKNEVGGLLITSIVNFHALILVAIYQFKEDEEWFLGKNNFGVGMRECGDSEKSSFCGGVGWRKNEVGGLLITSIVNFQALILVELYHFKEDEEWFSGRITLGDRVAEVRGQ